MFCDTLWTLKFPQERVKRSLKSAIMPNASIQELRKRNIQRNKDLFKSLQLDAINDSITRVTKPKSQSQRRSSTRKKLSEVPTRRSKRLASTPEGDDESRKQAEESENNRLRDERVKELRNTRLIGDFSLFDLVTKRGKGILKHEERIHKSDTKNNKKPVKEDDADADADDDSNGDDEVESDVLAKLLTIGDRYSAGDFYDIIRKTVSTNSKVLGRMRKELNSLKLSDKIDPQRIKLVQQRITSLLFHPSQDDRLVVAGDTNGSLGVWAVDASSTGENPSIITIKPHGRAISKVAEMPTSPNQIASVSYDGSARIMDIHKQRSIELFSLTNKDDEILGISDMNIHMSTPQSLIVSTLEGQMYHHDTRTPGTMVKFQQLLRLHDKKVGGFSVNPNRAYQIASASLDRSFKIWDLRNISRSNSHSEIADGLRSPHLYGGFSSRLSVSNVDWNSSNRLICNGYDDSINIVDLSGNHEYYPDVNLWQKSYVPTVEASGTGTSDNIRSIKSIHHNCQTGRWVSILKARWQKKPADNFEKFVIANMKRCFDVYGQNGELIANLLSPEMTAVPAVVSFHPARNWLIGGTSSGKVFLWE